MYISRSKIDLLLGTYSEITGKTIFTIFDIDLDELEKRFNDILKRVPENSRKEIEEFVKLLIRNKEEIKRAVSGEDEELNRILADYFDEKLGEGVVGIRYWRVSEKIPVYVIYERNFIPEEGVLYKPSRDEVRRVRDLVLSNDIEKILPRIAKVDYDKRVIRIGDREFRFGTEEEFVRALETLGSDVFRRYVIDRIKKVLPFDVEKKMIKYPNYPLSLIGISLKPEEAGLSVPPEYGDVELVLSIDTYTYPKVGVTIETRSDTFLDTVRFTTSIDDLGKRITKELKTIEEIMREKRGIAKEIRELIKNGYNVSTDLVYIDDKLIPAIVLEKESENTTERLTIPFRVNKGYVSVSFRMGRKLIGIIDVDESLEKHGENPRDYIVRYEPHDRLLLIKKTEFTTVRDLINEVKKIKKIMTDTVTEYRKMIREAQKKPVGDEHLVLLYLLKGFEGINPVKLIGKTWNGVYSGVRRVLERFDPLFLKGLKQLYRSPLRYATEQVIEKLVSEGYITVTGDGDLFIGGKRVEDLLKDLGITNNIDEIKNRLVAMTVSTIIDSRGDLPDELATPKIIETIDKYGGALPKIDTYAKEYNGRPLWHSLSRETRVSIINTWSPIEMYEALTKHPEVFGIDEEYMVKRMVERNWNLGTLYLGEKKPHIIMDRDYKVVKMPDEERAVRSGFVGIEVGDFVAQVASIDRLDPLSVKRFVVYHRDPTSIGVFVEARSVDEAVEKVSEIYNEARKIVEDVRNLMAENKPVELRERYVWFYKVVEVFDEAENRSIELSYENIDEIKGLVERYRENRMVLENI